MNLPNECFLDAEWLHQDFILQCHSLAATRTLQSETAAAKAPSVLTVSLQKSTATLCALKGLATLWRSPRASKEPPPLPSQQHFLNIKQKNFHSLCFEAHFLWAASPGFDKPGLSFFIEVYPNCKHTFVDCLGISGSCQYQVLGKVASECLLLQGWRCRTFREAVLQTLVLTSGYLICYHLSMVSSWVGPFWPIIPLTKQKDFPPCNCLLLDSYSFKP